MAVVALTGAGNVTTAISTSAVSLAVALPSNTAVGDLLVASVAFQNSTIQQTPTATGWTRMGPVFPVPGDTGGRPNGLFYITVPDVATLNGLSSTWTWTGSGTTGRVALHVQRVTGVNLTNPVDSFGIYKVPSTDTAQAHVIPETTAVAANTLLYGFLAVQANSVAHPLTVSWSAGTAQASVDTIASGTNTSTVLGVMAQTLTAAGATGTRTATVSGTSSVAAAQGYLVTFTPKTGAPLQTSQAIRRASTI